MALLKCKMCGGNLTVNEGMKIVECDFCGTMQTVPNVDDEKKTNLFNRANRLRLAGEFDRASSIYESIIVEFPSEAEAYWGLCLCKYGIEYVDDPRTAEKIPTCHRASFENIFNDPNYKSAIAYSDAMARGVYEREAQAIDVLQKNILNIVYREKPFDVFICYKETDEMGDRTIDSVLAQDIYEHLTERGFKVFFARITLEDKLGKEYEPYIFAALNSAKVMLAIGTKEEYYNAVWVRNEWSRFLALMKLDRSKTLVPCYRGIDPYDMPPEFKNLQGQDMGKLGFIQDLTRGITKIIRQDDEPVQTAPATTTGAITKRGYFFLEDGDFVSADEYFDKALDENPEDSKAYVGKLLVRLQMADLSELEDKFVMLHDNKNFERAVRFATGADKARLQQIKENAERKWLAKSLTVGLKKYAVKKKREEAQAQKEREIAELQSEINRNIALATPEGYEQALTLCKTYRLNNIGGFISAATESSYARQLDIMRLLSSDFAYYSLTDIAESKYFKGTWETEESLEFDLEKMKIDGSVEEDSGRYFVKGARERRIALEYDQAVALMKESLEEKNYGSSLKAGEIFVRLGGYRDSAHLAAECRMISQQLKREEEAALAHQEQLRRIEEARREELRRQELLRAEEERRAMEQCRLDQIRVHNDLINAEIIETRRQLAIQQDIYNRNAGKIFGEGARLKKSAKAEIERLEALISSLTANLK